MAQTPEDISQNILRIVDEENKTIIGTAFPVEENYCITSHHNIWQLKRIVVLDINDSRYDAEWVEDKSDMGRDIAILKVKGLQATPLLCAKKAAKGKRVNVRGFIKGAKTNVTITTGKIISGELGTTLEQYVVQEENESGLNKWNRKPKVKAKVLRIKGEFHQGFSGAPTYDPEDSRVVGMFEALESKESGFMIPMEEIPANCLTSVPHPTETKERAVIVVDNSVREAIAAKNSSLSPIEKLLDSDPSISIPSAMEFIREDKIDDLENVVAKIATDDYLGTVNKQVFRMIFKAFPKQSGPLLKNLILNADKKWFAASNAADCLSVNHREFVADELGRILDSENYKHYDIKRMCIEGLGNLGAEQWRSSIANQIKTSDYDKLVWYACRALAGIFLHSNNVRSYYTLEGISALLQDVLRFVMSKPKIADMLPSLEYDIELIFSHCGPEHADILVNWLLYSNEPIFQRIAAYALGRMRLSRTVKPLIHSIDNRSEHDDDVFREVSRALGYIGGTDAVEALLRHKQIESIAYALGELDDFILYSDSLQKLLSLKKYEDRQAELLVYRAMGLKKDNRHVDRLRKAIDGQEPAQRGFAALALARVSGMQEREKLQEAYREAGTTLERVMTGLALIEIQIPEVENILIDLRRDLTIDSYRYIPWIQNDIISILRNTSNPLAVIMANSWEAVYRDMYV